MTKYYLNNHSKFIDEKSSWIKDGYDALDFIGNGSFTHVIELPNGNWVDAISHKKIDYQE